MRWPFFILIAWVMLGLEFALSPVLTLSNIQPQLLLVLVVFIAMHAPPLHVAYACLGLGLCYDLNLQHHLPLDAARDVVLVGPMAVGMVVGGWVALQLRPMVFRASLTGLAIVTLIAGAFVHLTAVALITARGLPGLPCEVIPHWSAADQLWTRFFEILYTAGLALPLGYLLGRLQPLFAFDTGGPSKGFVKR